MALGKHIYSTEEKEYMIIFGRYIKELRIKLGITQEELARRMDMSTQTVSAIENGKTDCQNTTCFQIAKALGVSMAELHSYEYTFKEELE